MTAQPNHRKFPLFIVLLAVLVIGKNPPVSEQLPLRATIALPQVYGRIDHMAFDPIGQLLFVAALSSGTVEVIDVRTAKRTRALSGLSKPQGVLYVAEFSCLAVSNGGNGTVQFYRGTSFLHTETVTIGNDPDNLRYDATAKQIYVGYGSGALAVLDAATGKRGKDIKLPAHPESFELEIKGTRIFANVPDSGQIAVIDRKRHKVVAVWRVRGMRTNFPMALDERNHRLFVGFRSPAKLVVLDSETGREIAVLDCAGDGDDLFYDAANKRIYLSGGAGEIDVFNQLDADRYLRLPSVPSAPGARTSLLVPERKALYVAVPRQPYRTAQIREYGLR